MGIRTLTYQVLDLIEYCLKNINMSCTTICYLEQTRSQNLSLDEKSPNEIINEKIKILVANKLVVIIPCYFI
jgi:hypothetical protein